MKLFCTIILGMMLLSNRSFAQDNNVATATTALQSVLSNLQQSVEKLGVENDQWASRDHAIKEEISRLQIELGKLQSQGDLLNKSTAKLQDQNSRRAERITTLEQENYALDNQSQKAEAGIKLIQQSLNAGYQENQKLLLQLKALTEGVPTPSPQPLSPEFQIAARRQKEELTLMKMINESQQRQETLHQDILDFQKNTKLLPVASALAHQELLKEQIKDLQAEVALYPSQKSSTSTSSWLPWGDSQLRQLTLELKVLERNYGQLKNLLEQMTHKVQSTKLTVAQQVEEKKLKGSIEDLNQQSRVLRANLDDLRSQMVDLDKRKSHLEEMIQK
jgi:chromosome segregation ATPase